MKKKRRRGSQYLGRPTLWLEMSFIIKGRKEGGSLENISIVIL